MDFVRRMARGREDAPARALGAVFLVVLAAVALVTAAAILIYVLL